MLEPPSTPSGASVASIEAASTLYSTSIADRFNLRGESVNFLCPSSAACLPVLPGSGAL